MTVEHARTLHSPNQHIHTLNDRVWRLERDRCDCTKIPTSQPADIVLDKPSPPPAAEGVLWGLKLGWDEKDLMRVRASDWQAEPTGYKTDSSSNSVNRGWCVVRVPGAPSSERIIAHLDNKYPPKKLVNIPPSPGVGGFCVWRVTDSYIAVGKSIVPLSSTGNVEYDGEGPNWSISGGFGLNDLGEEWVLYTVYEGRVEELSRFRPPRDRRSHTRIMAYQSVYIDVKTTTTGSSVAAYDVDVYYRSGTSFSRQSSRQNIVRAFQQWLLTENQLLRLGDYGTFNPYQITDPGLLQDIQDSTSYNIELLSLGNERVLVICRRRSYVIYQGQVERKFDTTTFGMHIYVNHP